jgi:hypothetical protein
MPEIPVLMLLFIILAWGIFGFALVLRKLDSMEAQRGADLGVDRAEIRRLSLKLDRIVRTV